MVVVGAAVVVVGAAVVVVGAAVVVVGAAVVVGAGASSWWSLERVRSSPSRPFDVRFDWVSFVAQSIDCTSPGARCSIVVAPIAHDADKTTAAIATIETQSVRRVMKPP